ncbi:MAG TPA: DUF2878 domain-containing protein [Spongiibacteraceae bacterium]|nr:DUF2878 domain-containing protein [Spongiibacteraceae bacterium]
MLLFNALAFQLGWIACVLGGDRLALPTIAIMLVLHAIVSGCQRAEWLVIALSAALGIGLDSALHFFGILRFDDFASWGVPLWLAALWLLFATTLNHSLGWLQGRPLLASLVGALLAPLSYWVGARFGAARFGIAVPAALAVLAVCWGLLLPLLGAMMRHRIRVLSLCSGF